MIVLLILIISTATGYELKCPAKAEWRLRAIVSCYSEDKYACLLNLLEEKYMENCSHTDNSSIGSKLVFQPLFNLAECNAERYQPIVFTTHRNSECIFSKSKCADDGQVVFRNDSSRNDVTCRCDYRKRYAFVTKPKNRCVCNPSEEDCSCFRVSCTKLSADYQCVTDGDIMVNSTCQEILPNILQDTDDNTAQLIESNLKSFSNAKHVAYFIIASIVVYFVVAVTVLFKVSDFGEISTHIVGNETKVTGEISSQIDENETKDEVVRQPNDTTVADDISTHSNGNETTDDEKQKFIHELFLKGECGKLHFARLVFIGKHGVGKTSLMRRLLWHKKEDVTSTKSTDGIEVEKCNINIADGKWSPCNETDDDVRRLIRQVFKGKMVNEKRKATETVEDQEPLSSNKDESTGESKEEIFKSSDESDDIYFLNNDSKSKSDESDVSVDIPKNIADDKYEHAAEETDLNQVQPDIFKLEKIYDSKINNYTKENESDLVNDESINEMTSTIMKSCLQLREKEQDDTLAFCWLWDFAGQKDFYATHQVFLSKHAVFLLITDSLEFSTSEDQGIDFEGSAQYVSFWFDAIHCYWSNTNKGRLDPPIIVVCTKEDQIKEPSEREIRQNKFKENLRKVWNNQAKKGHLRNVYFISNTEDTDSVFEKIRKDISSQAMEMEDWGRDCPLKWLLFQQVLMKLKDNNVPIASTKELVKIAKHKDIDINEDNEIKQCLQCCHDIGTVVYFDEKNLADHVILDPKWLINAFRCLVSDKIDVVIEVSDDWETLIDTGQLTDSLISLLFKKEPELKFEENKAHLIEVMKRFDIIVNLKNSTELYMPCMIKSCSFSEVQKQVGAENQPFYKTSWLCLEFKFLPPAFFNHIIAWYIKQYEMHAIIDKETRSKRKAIYRNIGIFDLDLSCCEQLVVCEGPNVIAIQVWDSGMSNKTYEDLESSLYKFIETLRKHYNLHISYTKAFTCSDGDFKINRKKIEELFPREFRCSEHKTLHTSFDLVRPWKAREQLMWLIDKEYEEWWQKEQEARKAAEAAEEG